MKNRKLFLLLPLLVLFLGVGYAVVSSIGLQIGGTANVENAELKVAFNGNTEVSNEEKVKATAVEDSLSATILVTNLQLNETVTATYYIRNKETDVNSKISISNIENDKDDFFEVTTDIDSNPKTIEAGDVDSITITIKLIKTPINESDSEANINILLTASPTA